MKKLFSLIAVAFVAMSVNAQVYVGGSLGIDAWSSQKNSNYGDRSETTFSILPEVGYNLNDEWAVGTVIGYVSDKWVGVNGISESAFTFNPYARYTYLKAGKVSLFVDGGVDFTTASKDDWNELAIGLKPGLAVSLSDNISFVSHLGFIGYDVYNPDGDDNNTSKFGLDLSGNNLTFGLYFNF